MKYSERLGELSDQQIQSALERFNLGHLVSAKSVEAGLFGQNVFVTSDQGEFVLRGKPHYPWQFPTEQFFAGKLHQAGIPVPWPYQYEPSSELFGWPYVVMPKMPGQNLSDNLAETTLTDKDRIAIAVAQGKLLAQMQKVMFKTAGKYDIEKQTIVPFAGGYTEWIETQVRERLQKAKGYNKMTTEADIQWVEEVLTTARKAMELRFVPVFCMTDYKPGNMTVSKVDDNWQVTGLFDLMESYSGNGEADVSRMFCCYIEQKREELAYSFLSAYLNTSGKIEGFEARFPVFMLYERSIIWEFAQRRGKPWWNKELTFHQWVERFTMLDTNILERL